MLPILSLNWNYLVFIWLGAFVTVNLFTAGYIVYQRKRNLPILNCSGAIILSAYFIFAILTFFVFDSSETQKNLSIYEFFFVIFSAWFLMILNYLLADTKKAKTIKFIAFLCAICGSFFFINSTDFSYLKIPVIFALVIAALFWLWLAKSFVVMNKVPGLTISTVGLISFGTFFVAFFNNSVPQGVALLAVTLACSVLGFRAWNKYPAKILLNNAAVIPLAFLCGWWLIKLAAAGFWAAALILPLYYLVEIAYNLMKNTILKSTSKPFAIQIEETKNQQEKLVPFIFRKNIPLFLLAPLATTPSYGLFFLGLAFLFVIYNMYQLKHFGEKEPSLREITSGIYNSAKQGLSQQKQMYQEIINKKPENDNDIHKDKVKTKTKAKNKTIKRKKTTPSSKS